MVFIYGLHFSIQSFQVMVHFAIFEDFYSMHYTGKVLGYNVGAKQLKEIKMRHIIHSLTSNITCFT